MVNIPTKHELSMFSYYAECELGVIWTFNRAHTTSYLTLVETVCLSCAVFEL